MTETTCTYASAAIGFGVISKMMLSGCDASPETPFTAGAELEAAK
jgi:hypothetical protein